MKKGIIGKKIGMTQIFDANGNVIPVTVIEAGPCTVTMKKTVATDGYDAVQLGFVDVEEKKLNKPEAGHFRKAGVSCKKHLKEFRLDDVSGFNTGDTVTADIFEAGEKVDVTGITKEVMRGSFRYFSAAGFQLPSASRRGAGMRYGETPASSTV